MTVFEPSSAALTLPIRNDHHLVTDIGRARHDSEPAGVAAGFHGMWQQFASQLVLAVVVGLGMLLNMFGAFRETESWWPYEKECSGETV